MFEQVKVSLSFFETSVIQILGILAYNGIEFKKLNWRDKFKNIKQTR